MELEELSLFCQIDYPHSRHLPPIQSWQSQWIGFLPLGLR
jgi:hypothetical protein